MWIYKIPDKRQKCRGRSKTTQVGYNTYKDRLQDNQPIILHPTYQKKFTTKLTKLKSATYQKNHKQIWIINMQVTHEIYTWKTPSVWRIKTTGLVGVHPSSSLIIQIEGKDTQISLSQPTTTNIHKSQHKREEKLGNITQKMQVTPAAITDDQELRLTIWTIKM